MDSIVLTYDQIIDLEYDLDKSDPFYPQARAMWMAMSDWSTAMDNTDELLKALKRRIPQELTKRNLERYSDKECSDWNVMEALCSVIELFNYYPEHKTIDKIIESFNAIGYKKLSEQKRNQE